MKINKRLIEINLPPGKSVFLWGPRKTGKTWWVSRALHALMEDGPVGKACIVSLEKQPRALVKNIESLPWRIFLEKLWQNDLGLG